MVKKFNQRAINLIRKLTAHTIYPLFYNFRMTDKEQEVFDFYIKWAKYYLEFGSGGSTLRVLQKSKATIYSIESSLDWIKNLSRYLIIRRAKQERLFFHYVDIGETRRWGYPVSNNSANLFPKYSNCIFNLIESNKIDTVLVDGRFRVACVLSVILNMHSNEKLIILFHDFWYREKYHIVLKYLTEIQRIETLGVFQIKSNIDLDLVKQDYENYKNIPD